MDETCGERPQDFRGDPQVRHYALVARPFPKAI